MAQWHHLLWKGKRGGTAERGNRRGEGRGEEREGGKAGGKRQEGDEGGEVDGLGLLL